MGGADQDPPYDCRAPRRFGGQCAIFMVTVIKTHRAAHKSLTMHANHSWFKKGLQQRTGCPRGDKCANLKAKVSSTYSRAAFSAMPDVP